IADLPEVEVHSLYRAMDFLLEAATEIQHDVFFSVADLFNLEVDLLFLDTTTTYFEIEGEDEEEEREADADAESRHPASEHEPEPREALRKRGKESKDSRPDLAQVVIAFAVTR